MDNIEIRSLAGLSFKELFIAFKEAFKDYELQLDMKELEMMLTRRGFQQELSFGAFNDDRLVSFTFNGIGTFKTYNTAYDTGTGTIEEFRGKGLAGKVFKYSIPVLKDAGVQQYLLEVLQHNSNAVHLYKKMGFSISREFNYYAGLKKPLISEVRHGNDEVEISPVEISSIIENQGFNDFNPSWQNSLESVQRNIDSFCILGALEQQKVVGYVIIEKASGDITQLAVDKNTRRKGVATRLLKEGMAHVPGEKVKCINVESDCKAMDSFMINRKLKLAGKQYEMILDL